MDQPLSISFSRKIAGYIGERWLDLLTTLCECNLNLVVPEQSTSLVSLLCITRIQMHGFGGGFLSEAITIGVAGVHGLPIRPRSLDG